MLTSLILYVLIIIPLVTAEFKPCSPRNYGHGKIVCVCNETYCDSIGQLKLPDVGKVNVYESNSNGLRFKQTETKFQIKYRNQTVLQTHRSIFTKLKSRWQNFLGRSAIIAELNVNQQYQEILGFGGAFTDSAGININSLSYHLQQEIIKGYYSPEGLEYNIGRVPMASCDFSTREYSYCDVIDDFNLLNFELAPEDLQFKIPFIKQAINGSGKPILLIGTPWSSPFWMKTNNKMHGDGILRGSPGGPYYQTWANYFVKFFQAYEKHNITFWGVTAQNEPLTCYIKDYSFQCLGFTPELQRDFIKQNLGPTLTNAGYGIDKLKFMILDDQRVELPRWAEVVLGDPEAADYVSGIAFHWYTNFIIPAKLLDITHNKFPDKFILSTEASAGSITPPKVDIGSWKRAEDYAHDIIEDLLHYTVGWVDWNLALDLQGGPNWAKNFVDSPILVNATANEFYRQPMYYALGHFSKFLPKGSFRIDLDVSGGKGVELAAFKRPDSFYVLIAVNRGFKDVTLTVRDPDRGQFTHNSTAHSIQSFIWKNVQ